MLQSFDQEFFMPFCNGTFFLFAEVFIISIYRPKCSKVLKSIIKIIFNQMVRLSGGLHQISLESSVLCFNKSL